MSNVLGQEAVKQLRKQSQGLDSEQPPPSWTSWSSASLDLALHSLDKITSVVKGGYAECVAMNNMSDRSDTDSDSVEEIITVRPLPVPRLKQAQEKTPTFLKSSTDHDSGRGSEGVRSFAKQVVFATLALFSFVCMSVVTVCSVLVFRTLVLSGRD